MATDPLHAVKSAWKRLPKDYVYEGEACELVENVKGKSEIWEYFRNLKRKSNNTIVQNRPVCITCRETVKNPSGTTNLTSHLRTHHHAIWLRKFSSIATTPNSTTASPDPQTPQTPQSSPPSVAQYYGRDAPAYSSKSNESKKITNALSYVIAKDMRPFRFLETQAFEKLVYALNPRYTLPGRTYFTDTAIPNLYKDTKSKILSDIRSVNGVVSLTTDGWTSRSTVGYETITASYITNDWVCHSVVLQTRELPGKHTGVNLGNNLNDAIKEWGVCNDPPLVSDNAANMVSCGRYMELSIHLSCLAHTLNLAVKKGIAVSEVDSVLSSIRKIVTFFHRSVAAAEKLKTKCTLLKLTKQKLVMDVQTRWNSSYDMVDTFIHMMPAVYAALSDLAAENNRKNKNDKLEQMPNANELCIAQQMVKCLKPMKQITETLSTEKYPTSSTILPLQKRLVNVLFIPEDSDPPAIVSVKAAMLKDFSSRYSSDTIQETLHTACILDPRFKSICMDDIEEELAYVRLATLAQAVTLSPPTTDHSSSVCNVDETDDDVIVLDDPEGDDLPDVSDVPPRPEPEPIPRYRRVKRPEMSSLADILGEAYKVKRINENETDRSIHDEINEYRKLSNISITVEGPESDEYCGNPFSWWKTNERKYPHIAVLAKKYLSIPATSVASERVFSCAGDVVTADRSCILPAHVDQLVFLKKNLP